MTSALLLAALLSQSEGGAFGDRSGGGLPSVSPTISTSLTLNGPLVQTATTIAADDTTPSVAGGGYFVTSANTGATAITDLDNPVVGSTYTICGGSNTNSSTIADSGNFNLDGGITLALDVCIDLKVQADNDYVERGRSIGTSSGNLQTFTGGAGAYTWTKPAGATSTSLVYVLIIGAGGAGGSGGFDTSDSGGGGGAAGALLSGTFFAGQLSSTVTVTLVRGNGGAAKTSAGNGNIGDNTGAASFGAYMVLDAHAGSSGAGGSSSAGTAGTGNSSSYTTVTGLLSANGGTAGSGDDTAGGTQASSATPNAGLGLPFIVIPPTGGGGGGGTNGGANFTAGGAGGVQYNQLSAQVLTATASGGASDGASGGPAPEGGISVAGSSATPLMVVGGGGGGGGAGAIVVDANGGDGANGGNCGGGGGGGGAKNADADNESGAGGDGGASCIFVYTIL